jgi:undecaprenyl-diphosphatase
MTTLQALLFGCLQGLAEFLPVSSSGHLTLLKGLFGLQDVPQLFDVLLHIATLIVVCAVFRRTICGLLAALGRFLTRRRREGDNGKLRLILAVIVATFFTGVIGLAVKDFGEALSAKAVSGLLLVTAVILLSTRRLEKKAAGKPEADKAAVPGVKAGVITGIAQGIGVLPGISRSGITISAALFAGLNRAAAGEFSFLLSVPAILGALVLSLRHAEALTASVPVAALVAGMASALVTGWLSLRFLLRVVRGGRLYLFAAYLVPVGILGLIFL